MSNGSFQNVPPLWGNDKLTDFFDMARSNAFGSFSNLREEYASIAAIDEAFLKLVTAWLDPENMKAAAFAFRAHSAYRAAASLALSTQIPESYMVMRGCIENALYANHVDHSPDMWDVWSKRGESEVDRKRCVRAFSGPNLFASLRARDQRLGDITGALYERTIDFGAHPNELGIGSLMDIEETDSGPTFSFSYLCDDGMPLRLCLKSIAQAGLIALDMLCLVFPLRCAETGIPLALSIIKPRF
jgi:hypothetical protein